MSVEISPEIFKDIERAEDIFQILATGLFIITAFFTLPLNLSPPSISGPIPMRYWFLTAMPMVVLIASGVIRWVTQVGDLLGQAALNRLEDRIIENNQAETEQDSDNERLVDSDDSTTDVHTENEVELDSE